MMRRGQQPTVAEVAEAAGVHRATAYRYFSSARSLRAEAAIAAFDIDPEEVYARALDHDPITLIDAAVMAVCRLMFGEEALFRQNLLAVLEQWFARHGDSERDQVPIRSTRRFAWIDPAIEPLQDILDADEFRRLRHALALTFGPEAVVVTRDVCRLGVDEATEIMRWAAATLMRAAIAGRQAQPDEAGAEAWATELGHG